MNLAIFSNRTRSLVSGYCLRVAPKKKNEYVCELVLFCFVVCWFKIWSVVWNLFGSFWLYECDPWLEAHSFAFDSATFRLVLQSQKTSLTSPRSINCIMAIISCSIRNRSQCLLSLPRAWQGQSTGTTLKRHLFDDALIVIVLWLEGFKGFARKNVKISMEIFAVT